MEGRGQGQLAGVRVIDLTTVVMGPLATRMLADMGADVIKVETANGDLLRHYPPHRNPAMSGMTLNIDRNKRDIVLDLKDTDDLDVMHRLIETADVFVTNVRINALGRLGLAYDDVAAIKPDIVYCNATGFDSEGPRADEPAYDDVIQAMSGLAHMFTWNGGEPAFVPSIVADKTVAVHVAMAICASLYRRSVSGQGDHIEVPMAETMAAFNLVEHLNGMTFEPPLGPFSYKRIRTPHRRPRPTADGWIAMLPYSDDNWRQVFTIGERPDLIDDPRFQNRPDRVTNADPLYIILNEITPKFTTEFWVNFCREKSIPAAPITDLSQAREDEYFTAVGLLQDEEHPTEGAYKRINNPIRSHHRPEGLFRHAPRVGEHNDEVRAEIRAEIRAEVRAENQE